MNTTTGTPSATTPSVIQRMARIIVTLSPGEGIDQQEIQQAVVRIFGYSQGFLNNRTNTLQGWDNKWINVGKNNLGLHTLLIIPQDMTGRDFIHIATPRRRLCFTPSPKQAQLKEGHTYHYSIKVQKEKLEVMWVITKDGFGTQFSQPVVPREAW